MTSPKVMAKEIKRYFGSNPLAACARAEAMNLENQPATYWAQVRAELIRLGAK